jgi:serine/threonine-protein kinase RsbW
MSESSVCLSFPAKAEYLLLARLVVAGALRRLAFEEPEIADLKLAVTEACGNAVRHAYVGRAPGCVDLELVPCPDRLEVVVSDTGAGLRLPLPERPPAPSEAGGMGLGIIRSVVDEVEITRGPGGRGTIVHMIKLSPPRAGSDGRDKTDRSRV